MSKLFGTDGIRKQFGVFPLDQVGIEAIAYTLSQMLEKQKCPGLLIARDTRESGKIILHLFKQIFSTSCIDFKDLGILPTPALSSLLPSFPKYQGIMISASHNPAQDNGLKFFKETGEKWGNPEEEHFERLLTTYCSKNTACNTQTQKDTHAYPQARCAYQNKLTALFPADHLQGLHLIVDGSQGAFSDIAPLVLQKLGAQVTKIACSPNGKNINHNCGVMSRTALTETIYQEQADFGLAFDGDGDRILLLNKDGFLLDGDQMLAALALDWKTKGKLAPELVVSTTMANGAMDTFLNTHNIHLVRTTIGDRAVTEKMRETGALLGGETSGHLLISPYSKTSDGLLTALFTLPIFAQRTQSVPLFTPFPHRVHNIPLTHEQATPSLRKIENSILKACPPKHRLHLRPSGTEPLLRIMAEAPSMQAVNDLIQKACAALQ